MPIHYTEDHPYDSWTTTLQGLVGAVLLFIGLLTFYGGIGIWGWVYLISPPSWLFTIIGAAMVWDWFHKKFDRVEVRKYEPFAEDDAADLMAKAKKIAQAAPNYRGNGSELSGTGGAGFPNSVVVAYEQGQKVYVEGLQICVSVGFTRSGKQYGPVYHYPSVAASPWEYGIPYDNWLDVPADGGDRGQE